MGTIQDAIRIFQEAVSAVNPSALMRRHLSRLGSDIVICGEAITLSSENRIFVMGAGKASAIMAQTAGDIFGEMLTGGIVVTKYGHGLDLKKIRLIEAGHPVPDRHGIEATNQILEMADGFRNDDIVLFLLSGGASSLLADYPPGSGLAEIRDVYEILLKSGADIHEMNTVRKHISKVKGGQLAKRIHPARLYTLILSDVTGDDPDVIGSGPTVPDKSSFTDAWNIITKYGMTDKLPEGIYRHLQNGLSGITADIPKPGDTDFAGMRHQVIGSNIIALEAAAAYAHILGYHAHIATHTLTGDATDLGRRLAANAIAYNGPMPACILYGGESTVTVKGTGLGGRNQELALAGAMALGAHDNITILSAGTDGTDGPTDAAGAVLKADLLRKAINSGYDPVPYLRNNDSYHFLDRINALVKTGPTHTNVMDIMMTLIN